LLDSIFKSGQASDIVAILSKYDDEAIVAINKILDKDAVAALIRDCGDDGVLRAAIILSRQLITLMTTQRNCL